MTVLTSAAPPAGFGLRHTKLEQHPTEKKWRAADARRVETEQRLEQSPSGKLADEFGVSRGHVSKLVNGVVYV